MYPETMVISSETGHNRSYGRYPYGDYRTNHDFLIFPVANSDDRLPKKERVHGVVIPGSTRVYPISLFGEEVTVISDNLNGRNVVVVGNGTDNFVVSFLNDSGDGTPISFTPVQNNYPIVMSDESGTMWNVFGKAVSGPGVGTQLTHARSFMGYWFSFAAFYPEVTIYGEI